MGDDCPHLAEDQIDLYAKALFSITQTVFEIRRSSTGLRRESIHDVALIVGECSALLKLHLGDRIAVENKVIERLVEPDPARHRVV